ncbi:hypothetical protein QBC33DRAFT_198358 [Phialemonium atrogriseum]|uniref:Vegetative cell wall protein gp1 n=1 Tax=Phialemonium atrogriseum TaxID=1093897 RepID=A0AAJ0FDB2_9PEZI|nr:uncharacterized protein QBC33DRAFT_198358 [Phialemonium atrogriseum]KAK1764411.1 hypothetical protein QBC33DRAFT_198358 [Phialemonium atrogriseum]
MAYNSPNRSTPGSQEYYYEEKYASPSPTPSPRGPPYYYAQTPQRPATRAHFRHPSSGAFDYGTPRTPSFSPRYTSDGQYATANVSSTRSPRKHHHTYSVPRVARERRHSTSYYRASDSHGESDEDEYVEINGITYVLPARSRSKRYREYTVNAAGLETDHRYYPQGGHYLDRESAGYNSPRYEPDRRPAAPVGHSRRNSTSVPQRPQTARPGSSHKKAPPPPPKATEADAKRHRIPPGYSLKNWDPTEEPIMLLGSVFDANSLGKWIYDWTVYKHGPAQPMSDMAGELWLLLIQLSGKLKRAEEVVPRIRSAENKEMVEDFIESGERLGDKLRKLLKACEAPMLKSAKKKEGQLGMNAGVEFVLTLFGRERELEKTERFMANVRIWSLRFDANCEEVLKRPTM